jgi:dihydroflavonol-4-reductase
MHVVLVTGATGFIGSNLVIALLGRGYSVRALRRPTSNTLALDGINVEYVFGDVNDPRALRAAMDGCDTVFHTAAVVSFWRGRREEQVRVNVEGTRTVVETCLAAGIQRLVHTSSVAALGHRTDGQLIDESAPYDWGTRIAYRYTKHLAEREVLKGVERGLDAVIVNPTVVVGQRDLHFHGGNIIRRVAKKQIPVYVEGGLNVVSVDDVVRGIIAAVERGRTGERYILGSENVTHTEFLEKIARVVETKPPRRRVPSWLTRIAGRAADLLGAIGNFEPPFSSDLTSSVGIFHWYSIAKAQQELWYSPTPVETGIRRAYEWYVANGLLKPRGIGKLPGVL